MPILPTQAHYARDAYARQCAATVLAAQTTPAGPRLALDATVFYPEGGGQPADTGTLRFADGQTARVLDVHEEQGVIWHTLDALPDAALPGAPCTAQIDWARRFDHMQQHTGEHILSGTLHRLYGAQNVGFHIGREAVRMDTDIPLSDEQLRAAETAANQVVWDDPPVEVLYPTPDQLAGLAYRSKKEIDGQVRIVRIAGADTCACCGTHTARAGQVGLIKLVASEHYKGGNRLTLLCGGRALAEMQAMRARQQRIGALLSAKSALTADAVQRLCDEHTALKFAHYGLTDRLFGLLAAQADPAAPAIHVLPGLTPDELHRLAALLAQHTSGLCAALTPTEKGVGYALALADGDARPLTRALNAAFAGRGGGKPGLCQGSCAAGTPEAIAAWLLTQAKSKEYAGGTPQ